MATKKKRFNLTLDKEVVELVDQQYENRSAFVERAIIHQLKREKEQELEEKHIQGYKDNPVGGAEFESLLREQEWPT